jgi:subtilisin family serine protease
VIRRSSSFRWRARLARVLALAVAATALLSTEAVQATPVPAGSGDHILVTFDRSVTGDSRQTLVADVAAGPLEPIGLRSFRLPVRPGAAAAAVEALAAEPGLSAEEDHRVSVTARPDDTFYSEQWALADTGQYDYTRQTFTTPGADINAEAAWSVTTGSRDVVVGIVDSGIDLTHPDLVPNLWSNPGGIGGCPAGTHGYNVVWGNCVPVDAGAHGSHVAGIIGARGGNGVGVTGVNWNVSLMALRAGDATGGETSDMVAAIHWAVEAKRAGVNVRVLNASFGSGQFVQALYDEIAWAGANDILVVAAAGNGADDGFGDDVDLGPEYPCAFDLDNVVCVANTRGDDDLSEESNFGARSVDLAAPGTDILSTVPINSGSYGRMSGTSMATPFVTGAAALALSQGYLSVAQLKARLLAAVDPVPELAGVVRSGGRLDLCKVVAGCQASAPYDDFADAYVFNGQGGRSATSRGATRQAGEPGHGSASVWFSTLYTGGGTLTVDAATGYRSRLSVYKGSALGSLTLVASDPAGRDHRVNIASSKAQTFHIALTSDDGGYGPYGLSIMDTPPGSDPLPKQAFAPDPVTGLAATAGDGTATLTWDPPVEHRGAVSGYGVVLYRNGRSVSGTLLRADERRFVPTGLTNGATYTFRVVAFSDGGTSDYSAMSAPFVPLGPGGTPDPGVVPAGPPGAPPAAGRFGYWMLNSLGTVYAFGDAPALGDPAPYMGGIDAIDIEPSPTGGGYWVVSSRGKVYNFGEHLLTSDGVPAAAGRVVSMSATPSGQGYWLFTERGQVFAYGDAGHFGDLAGRKLNAAVLDSIPTPSGRGYYMVAADGGIFAFGDAEFRGSMGGRRLNSPVQSLVPDGDGGGYWLVAADGGVFAFDAPFRGSMGGQHLNKPVSGMIRYGNGYLMVAEDGGIFNFSDRPFSGSLGSKPSPRPVVAVAALPR